MRPGCCDSPAGKGNPARARAQLLRAGLQLQQEPFGQEIHTRERVAVLQELLGFAVCDLRQCPGELAARLVFLPRAAISDSRGLSRLQADFSQRSVLGACNETDQSYLAQSRRRLVR